MTKDRATTGATPVLAVDTHWESLLEPAHRGTLERILPAYVSARRWFGGKARTISHITVEESISVPDDEGYGAILFLDVHYSDGHDAYVIARDSVMGMPQPNLSW